MSAIVALERETNCADNHHQQLEHQDLQNRVVVVVPGKEIEIFCFSQMKCPLNEKLKNNDYFLDHFRDPSPCRLPNPPVECAARPQAIRRQSSTTEEILIARGFRRQSTTEEMIRCRNFRRQSSQSDDVCQRYRGRRGRDYRIFFLFSLHKRCQLSMVFFLYFVINI